MPFVAIVLCARFPDRATRHQSSLWGHIGPRRDARLPLFWRGAPRHRPHLLARPGCDGPPRPARPFSAAPAHCEIRSASWSRFGARPPGIMNWLGWTVAVLYAPADRRLFSISATIGFLTLDLVAARHAQAQALSPLSWRVLFRKPVTRRYASSFDALGGLQFGGFSVSISFFDRGAHAPGGAPWPAHWAP